MWNFFKGTLTGSFGLVMYGLYGGLAVGGLYWLWMAARMGSVLMFVVGLLPPAYLVTSPVGLYSLVFGKPHWVVSLFGPANSPVDPRRTMGALLVGEDSRQAELVPTAADLEKSAHRFVGGRHAVEIAHPQTVSWIAF